MGVSIHRPAWLVGRFVAGVVQAFHDGWRSIGRRLVVEMHDPNPAMLHVGACELRNVGLAASLQSLPDGGDDALRRIAHLIYLRMEEIRAGAPHDPQVPIYLDIESISKTVEDEQRILASH